jgi:hypothetical protein
MFRLSLVLLVGLGVAGNASASSWADGLFDELSRDFGSVARGPTLSHPFRVVNKTKGKVRISDVRVSCNKCSSAKALKTELAPGEETAILVTMDTMQFQGSKNITVYIQFDQPNFEEVRLWVQANSRDDLTVNPDSLAFGRIKRGSTPSASVTVSFLGNAQWKILSVASDSNYVQPACKLVSQDAGTGSVTYEVKAKVRSDAPVGKWYTDIWLKTNNAATPRVRIPLTVEIESALSISPASVALGQVKVGEEAERKIILRGVKAFKVTGVKGADHQWSLKDSATEAKTIHVLTLTFRAAKTGEVNRTLRIITDLPEDGTIEFNARAKVAK